MKRVILRIAALCTVIALGLIAIAQAQRSGQKSADETAPVFRPANPEDASNPLRSPSVFTGNPLRDLPPAAPPADPFAQRAERSENPVRPASADVAMEPKTGESRTGGLPQFGQHASHGRDENATVPSRSAPPPAALPGMPLPGAGSRGVPFSSNVSSGERPLPPSGAERYPGVGREPDAREPAPFRVDASAAANLARPLNRGIESAAQTDVGASAEAMPAGEGTGRPGAKQLEGPQSPHLTIQKIAPPEIQVGKPVAFRTTVRNAGAVPAGNVEVRDQVPQGTRLIGGTPQPSRGPRGELVWAIGALRPGEEATVEMQLMPTAEGEIGSVATVHFDSSVSSRSLATRPRLVVQTTGTKRVLAGEQAMLTITVANTGSGVANGVVLEEHIPAGLQHPAGSELEYPVGDLRPGESRKLDLPLLAKQPGPLTNVLAARGEGGLRVEDRFELEVVAPQLDLALTGAKRRYLEREATYQVMLSNPGTAPAKQVELVAYLPDGLKFVRANNAGRYDEASRAVSWRLEELPSNQRGSVELVTMPTEAGQHAIRLRGTAKQGLTVEREQAVVVEGLADVHFRVADLGGPVEVGGQTTYEIRVTNQGSKDATSVQVVLLLPGELKPLAAEGPAAHAVDGTRVLFDALPRLAPKAEVTYRVRVQGVRAGDLRTRCQLLTAEMQSWVTQEVSTRVIADE